MSQFRDELSLIPRGAWITAVVIGFLLAVGVGAAIWNNAVDIAIFILPVAVMLEVYILLVGYVYGDARRRGMRYAVWTLIAIFVPNAIGILLYFLLRDPLRRPCPSCGVGCKTGQAYCPHCGFALRPICRECKRPLEESWRNCPHCGVAI